MAIEDSDDVPHGSPAIHARMWLDSVRLGRRAWRGAVRKPRTGRLDSSPTTSPARPGIDLRAGLVGWLRPGRRRGRRFGTTVALVCGMSVPTGQALTGFPSLDRSWDWRTCLIVQLTRPRASWRRLCRQPGFVGCLIATTVIALTVAASATSVWLSIWVPRVLARPLYQGVPRGRNPRRLRGLVELGDDEAVRCLSPPCHLDRPPWSSHWCRLGRHRGDVRRLHLPGDQLDLLRCPRFSLRFTQMAGGWRLICDPVMSFATGRTR